MATTKKRGKRPEKDLRRPIPRKALERGKAVAARYQVTIWREDGEWFGRGVEEPGAMGDGRTVEQCVRSVREALAIAVACHIDDREPIVAPLIDRGRKRAG